MKVTGICCGPAVNESELKAVGRLRAGLIAEQGNGEWLLLTNLTFSATHRLQSDEIDIIAIGPPGVRVIEVKHWSAAWVRQNQDRVEREADRVTNKARKIGTTLRNKIRGLPHVTGVFLVTEVASKVERLASNTVRGVPFCTFKMWREAVGVDSTPVLSIEQVRMAARVLEPMSGVAMAGELRRLAGYTRLVLQTPADERFHRVYRATHSSRQDRVFLHLYDWSASEAPNAEAKAQREFVALHRLQQYGWAPRIVDSFQETPGYPGEVAFFTVADPAAPCIKERATDKSWDSMSRLSFARGAVRALNELHEARADGEPMVHRNLTPRSILVRHDNTPILSDFEYARIPAEVTVASPMRTKEWDATTPPEVRAQGRAAADRRSDVYALCASLNVLFTKRDDSHSRSAIDILSGGTAAEPNIRDTLPELNRLLAETLGESIPVTPPPPARFWTEDQVVRFGGNDYRIVTRLGSGGVGTTFKVVEIDRDTKDDLGSYVAKVVRDRETGERVLRAHRLVRSHLRHTAFSTVYQIAPEWRDNDFAALMTWIEGEPLSEYEGLLRELAEDSQEESDETLAARWLRTACEGIGELHGNGLVHGDVSPRNLILSDADLFFTDYDCVARVHEPIVAPGTVMYCSPTCLSGSPVIPSDDFYALAASIFHVLFAKEPFRYQEGVAKDRGLNWDGVDREEYSMIAAFLDRATNPLPERRFASAADALLALDAAQSDRYRPDDRSLHGPIAARSREQPTSSLHLPGHVPTMQPERREQTIEWLRYLLQSYPGSLRGNRETRGLDSEFAALTYIETNLEQSLYRDIIQRNVNLVVLCGNAGDGKTALLQRLAKRIGLGEHSSATRILEGQTADGSTVRMNLDGSASWKGRSSAQLLDEFMGPFQHGPPNDDLVHLLAINDGRLLEWIENLEHDNGGPTPLTQTLTECLEDRGRTHDAYIRFVDLNQRSLVGSVIAQEKSVNTDFLDRLVDTLYGGERSAETWAPCHSCSAQDRCEVFRAVRLFAPGSQRMKHIRRRARQRLFEGLQAVHLSGDTHITVRELRATLVYILFGVHFCSDYHSAEHSTALPYWDRAFAPESPSRQGEVLRELARFDPALEAHPHIDRVLLHPPNGDDFNPALRRQLSPGPADRRAQLASERRRAYFEWPEQEIIRWSGTPDALGLAQGSHLRQFRDLAIADNAARDDIARRLCGGISRLETLPPQALNRPGIVPLRITPRTPTETAFWVEKRSSDFRLYVDLPDTRDVDRLHRQAILSFHYGDGRHPEELRLGAELFHLLLELDEGYQLGDISTDDTFAHLSIFVQRLVREDERRMIAWNPMEEEKMYEISAEAAGARSDARQRLRIGPHTPAECDAG